MTRFDPDMHGIIVLVPPGATAEISDAVFEEGSVRASVLIQMNKDQLGAFADQLACTADALKKFVCAELR